MKRVIVLAAAAALCLSGAAQAESAVEKPVRLMMEGFNKGDVAAVRALHTPDPTIIDETHPFLWTGPKAFDVWIAQLAKNEAAEGKSDGQVWFGAPTRQTVHGRTAYVIAPCTYTFKQKGRTMREVGTITFVLSKLGKEWKIASWTWTSPDAQPVQ